MEDNEKETEGTPTVEEQLATIQKEKADLETQLEEKSKGLKTAHAKLTQKDDELKRRDDVRGEIVSLKEQLQFVTGYLAETQGKTGADFEEAKATRAPDLLKRFQSLQAESEKKRQSESRMSEATQKAEELRARVEELGLTEDDEEYLEIQVSAIDGFSNPAKFKLAEKKIAKLENAKKTEKEAPKETEDQIKERLEREILVKHGLLKPEGAKPSAASLSFKKLEKEYSEGNITYAEYAKARQAQGL